MAPPISLTASTLVVLVAWVTCGLYFLASAFSTQRIQKRESRGALSRDLILLWGGYFLLFAQFSGSGFLNHPLLLPPAAYPFAILGAGLAVAGLAFATWARVALGRYWSGVVALKQDHQLVQSGPYRTVRHPLYTGLLAATLGAALAFNVFHALLGAALLWITFIGRAHREDTLLATRFGPDFAAYRARSGRLLPRLASAPRA